MQLDAKNSLKGQPSTYPEVRNSRRRRWLRYAAAIIIATPITAIVFGFVLLAASLIYSAVADSLCSPHCID